ncbi:MAG: agmatine deiminase family protein, partial [Solirubrobacteraceae bacterium]
MSARMPAEWAPHERTIMCWPARESMWQEHFRAAQDAHAEVANAIAAFEPVLMAADPRFADEARRRCGAGVEVVEMPLDDSWARDSGPIFLLDGDGGRAGIQFGFNAWGEKFRPWDEDAVFATRVLEALGEERRDATDLILEGGSITVDGEGTLITTEQCLFERHRNPHLSREEIEARLKAHLGVERVVWLGLGLVEDDDTDGHVDNICAFVEPGKVVLQTVADEANPNFGHCAENARRLRDAGLEVVELPWLPYAAGQDPPVVVPYTNFYLCNGGAIVPVAGLDPDMDQAALDYLGALLPDREVVGVPGRVLAL